MSDRLEQDQDLLEAFAATADRLAPEEQERLLEHASFLSDQAAVQAHFDSAGAQLDDLTRHRLLGHASRQAGVVPLAPPVRAGRQPPMWRVLQASLAVAALLMLVAGAHWWPRIAGREAPPSVATLASARPASVQVAPPPLPTAEEAVASALPEFDDGTADDHQLWIGLDAAEIDPESTDLASQFDALHDMEPSTLDSPSTEVL